jgi:hypothetical protein
MAKENRTNLPRVNFFDGQRVTEADLDAEQLHHRGQTSYSNVDFHGSGIVRDSIFESKILLDTSVPSQYTTDGSPNETEFFLQSGSFDGMPIKLDRQPTDREFGNRLEVACSDLSVAGRIKAKVLILGTTYDSTSAQGELVTEVLEFSSNSSKLSQYYYTQVLAVYFNNFSGGTGRNQFDTLIDSENTIGTSGKIIIRESEPLKVYVRTLSSYQNESPNIALSEFITSDSSLTIEDEIVNGLGSNYNINDLYFELNSSESLTFAQNETQLKSYGQKFLAKTNNIQKINLLLSAALINGSSDYSGNLVISLHKLSSDTRCITDAQPENLIDFDPEPNPIIELSYSQADLEELGYKLTQTPQVVSFDFSGTLIADPNIDPTLVPGEFYAILISRRGDNTTGSIILEKGYDKASRKAENGQTLNVVERFAKQEQRFVEFDPINLVYVDDSDSSLWFEVHSDTIEVTDGLAYTEDGFLVNVPKTEEYIGSTKISRYIRDIPLKVVTQDAVNYVLLQREDNFEAPSTHPRTGNFVNTRITDAPSIYVVTLDEYENIELEKLPIILGSVRDRNIRDAQQINGTATKPGLILPDEVIIVEPSSELLLQNLINRIYVPDTECQCNSRYRIIDATCETVRAGDLNSDNQITSPDITALVNLVGNTINSQTTERKILGGEISYIDFVKADLNNDGSIDGVDIEIIEDAVDGYVNFSIPTTFNILRLKLENILSENDYPQLYASALTPSAGSGAALATTDQLSFIVNDEREALSFRVGDKVTISALSVDSGNYLISEKTIDNTGLGVTLTVTLTDGGTVSFIGSAGFDVVVSSGTRTNTYADNLTLLDVPFTPKTYSIYYVAAPHDARFVDTCDLRRFVETSLLEKEAGTCICQEPGCSGGISCAPRVKNQKILSDDLYIPNGEIYSSPGIPYHGDIEYATITMPLPPGTISGCDVDLYNVFVKSADGSCLTQAGYPAMKFSDGTYVGCQDSGAETDVTKGRVKFTQAIASLYVDALVDGYAVDGYADATETSSLTDAITESFFDYSYPNSTGFADWDIDAPTPIYASITTVSGSNQPAIFSLETINAGDRYCKLGYPTAPGPTIPDITGDFVIDFTASRFTWEGSTLTTGKVSFFASLSITNVTTTSVVKLGWRQSAGGSLELFFSGEIFDIATTSLISDFDFSTPATDGLLNEIQFRLRRVDDVIFASYFNATVLDPNNVEGRFVRIGELPSMQPGSGSAILDFELLQQANPNAGKMFLVKLFETVIRTDFIPTLVPATTTALTVNKVLATSQVDRATIVFPVNLTSRTNIISATLTFTAASPIASTDYFNITPYQTINADNLGPLIDLPLEENQSFITSFSPGTVAEGATFDVDITSIAIYFLSKPGHLPGTYKGMLIEPSTTANSGFSFLRAMSLSVSYEDISTGVIFKIGVSIDPTTGIATLDTKNILYDSFNSANRTVLKFGVYLKKSGFRNSDIEVGIKDLKRIGIGTCTDTTVYTPEDLCFFISGTTKVGTFVQGPFPCFFQLT